MKPLSPVFYIKENKKRSICLIFLLFLEFVSYTGALYVTNPHDCWSSAIKYSAHYLELVPMLAEEGEDQNEIQENFEKLRSMIKDDSSLESIDVSSVNSFQWENIMGFSDGCFSLDFRTVKDFEKYCAHMHINCDTSSLKSSSMIMSRMFADNLGYEKGHIADKNKEDNIHGTYTLDLITDEKAYTLYFIDDNDDYFRRIMVFTDGRDIQEIKAHISELAEETGAKIGYMKNYEERTAEDYERFMLIYYCVLILLAFILSVMINAVFTGIYQKRNFEFALYKATGISRAGLIRKITSEILLMEASALIFGGAVLFTALYLFNNLVLYPAGKYLCYYNSLALKGITGTALVIIVPLIITRSRQIFKADIKEY